MPNITSRGCYYSTRVRDGCNQNEEVYALQRECECGIGTGGRNQTWRKRSDVMCLERKQRLNYYIKRNVMRDVSIRV